MITEVTWYKAVVNSLVPCDLCDHSQISHIVSNDVTSDILLTTLHVITDSPISDHMIGTSYRGPVRRSVFHCVWRTQRAPDRSGARSQGARTARKGGCRLWTATRPWTASALPFINNRRTARG
ncbi:unnamed protein product [Staurois parvus]|uniref:Uncharacterized protein n=1 Tax=Staurois parvus TaxID=386267 RepID=A0ABN9BPF2_9NEOB|nr:unnamed protein product [Staurois parvus]